MLESGYYKYIDDMYIKEDFELKCLYYCFLLYLTPLFHSLSLSLSLGVNSKYYHKDSNLSIAFLWRGFYMYEYVKNMYSVSTQSTTRPPPHHHTTNKNKYITHTLFLFIFLIYDETSNATTAPQVSWMLGAFAVSSICNFCFGWQVHQVNQNFIRKVDCEKKVKHYTNFIHNKKKTLIGLIQFYRDAYNDILQINRELCEQKI